MQDSNILCRKHCKNHARCHNFNHCFLLSFNLYWTAPAATFAACWGLTFFPSLLYLTRGGGARFRRPSRERTRTILPWIAHETQYWSFKYILGTVYSGKTDASEISRMAADSTMFLIVNLFIALSFGVHREQLEQRIGLT